jgi:hypothetical protein
MMVISLVWPNPYVAGCVVCLQFPATTCEDSSSASLIIRNSSTNGSRLFEFGVPQGSFLKVCGQGSTKLVWPTSVILSHAVTTCRTGAGRRVLTQASWTIVWLAFWCIREALWCAALEHFPLLSLPAFMARRGLRRPAVLSAQLMCTIICL